MRGVWSIRKNKKLLYVLFAAAFVCLFSGMSVQAAGRGLVKQGGAWYYYNKAGKPLKNRWKSIKTGKSTFRYYFGSDGKALCGTGKKAKVAKIGKYKYAFDKKGHMLTGVRVIGKKLYYFSSKGRFNKAKSTRLRKKAGEFKKASGLVSLLEKYGCKLKKTKFYGKGCLGDSQDGMYTFDHFKVSVFKYDTGEIVVLEVLPL